jgi:serine/threonine protein kinase
LQELHSHNVVFRDLKLENILVDKCGHIRLTDFGLSAKVSPTAWADHTIVDRSGTAMYQAPEVLAKTGHGRLVDFWALGVLTHVVLTGRPPFTSTSHAELYAEMQVRDLDLDSDRTLSHVSQSARDFIASLLQRDPAKRLGAGSAEGPGSIRAHPFFSNIDWEALLRREVTPPLPPLLNPQEELMGESAVRSSTDLRGKRSSGWVTEAETAIREKLFPRAHVVPLPRTRSKHREAPSDFVEYCVVNSADCSTSGRVSIGLDFHDSNSAARRRTWTGANHDYGRPL